MPYFVALLTVSLLCASAAFGGNLLPGDTSFEAGSAAWLGGESVDRDDAPSGKRVLRLTRAFNHGDIHYGLMAPDQEYVLSFRIRAPQGDVRAVVEALHVLYGPVGSSRTLSVTPAWQLVTLQLPKQPVARDVYFVIKLPEGAVAEVDAFMLNPGKEPEPYAPSAPVVVGIDPTEAPGNILFVDEAAPILRVGAAFSGTPGDPASRFRGTLSLRTADFSGANVNEIPYPLEIGAGENTAVDYPALSVMTGGYYVVSAELTNSAGEMLARQLMPFGVVPRPVEATADEASFGMHPAGDRLRLDALPRIGIKWVRSYHHWNAMEGKAGERRFPSQTFREFEKNGLSALVCMKLVEQPPAFAKAPDGTLGDEEALVSFLTWLAGNATPAVKVWEIENEPDLGYPTKLNMTLLDAAAYYGKIVALSGKALKAATPEIPVSAMSVSGGGADKGFIETACAAGTDSFDIMAIHPYTGARYIGPHAGRAIAPDSYIRERMLQAVKLPGGKRLWAGEIGWAYDTREPMGGTVQATFSNYVARALILMKSVPEVEKILWFKAQGCYERDHYQYGLWRSEFEPTAAAVFFANVAAKLEHARPYKPVFESDLRAYVFTARDGRPFAAVWRGKGEVRQIFLDQPADRVRVTDLFGNPVVLSEAEGKTVVPVTETPVWVELSGADAEALADSLGQIGIDLPPVTLTMFLCDPERVVFFVRNNLQQALSVRAELAASATAILPDGEGASAFPLEPREIKSVTLNRVGDDDAAPFILRAVTPRGTTLLPVNPAQWLACLRVGDPGEDLTGLSGLLSGPGAIVLNGRSSIYPPDPNIGWSGPDDQSGTFACGYDDRFFYFAGDVTDPVHCQDATTYRAWNGDSLQLALDTLANAQEDVFEFDGDDLELIAWLGPDGAKLCKTASGKSDIGSGIPGAKVEISREGRVTRYRLAIPLKELGKLTPMDGRVFGLNFIVNQNNGKGRRYWLGLTEGIGEVKYPFLYRKFRLVSEQQGR